MSLIRRNFWVQRFFFPVLKTRKQWSWLTCWHCVSGLNENPLWNLGRGFVGQKRRNPTHSFIEPKFFTSAVLCETDIHKTPDFFFFKATTNSSLLKIQGVEVFHVSENKRPPRGTNGLEMISLRISSGTDSMLIRWYLDWFNLSLPSEQWHQAPA